MVIREANFLANINKLLPTIKNGYDNSSQLEYFVARKTW